MGEFGDIFARRVELEVANGGQPWRVVYDPSRWPVAWHVRAAEKPLTYADVVDRLGRVLVEWDLELDGEPLPCDEESLWLFPRDALSELYNHLFWSEMGMTPGEDGAGKAEASQDRDGTSR